MSKFNAVCLILLGSLLLGSALVDCITYRSQIKVLEKRISELETEVKYYKIMEEIDDKIQLQKKK